MVLLGLLCPLVQCVISHPYHRIRQITDLLRIPAERKNLWYLSWCFLAWLRYIQKIKYTKDDIQKWTRSKKRVGSQCSPVAALIAWCSNLPYHLSYLTLKIPMLFVPNWYWAAHRIWREWPSARTIPARIRRVSGKEHHTWFQYHPIRICQP